MNKNRTKNKGIFVKRTITLKINEYFYNISKNKVNTYKLMFLITKSSDPVQLYYQFQHRQQIKHF